MQDYNPEDLLTLLAHVIIADNKVFQEEIDEFVRSSIGLGIRKRDGSLLTRKWLVNWFKTRHEQIKKTVEKHDIQQELASLFRRLRPMDEKQQVLDCMCSIAQSDGHFHINEKLLVALASGHWGMRAPLWNDEN